MLRFPSGVVANCFTGYDAHDGKPIRVHLRDAWIDVDDAFSYRGQRMRVGRRVGEKASVAEIEVGEKNQFALEIDHFAECVRAGREPHTPGEEGLQDQVLMEAIYESARTGLPVRLAPVSGRDTTRGPPPSAG